MAEMASFSLSAGRLRRPSLVVMIGKWRSRLIIIGIIAVQFVGYIAFQICWDYKSENDDLKAAFFFNPPECNGSTATTTPLPSIIPGGFAALSSSEDFLTKQHRERECKDHTISRYLRELSFSEKYPHLIYRWEAIILAALDFVLIVLIASTDFIKWTSYVVGGFICLVEFVHIFVGLAAASFVCALFSLWNSFLGLQIAFAAFRWQRAIRDFDKRKKRKNGEGEPRTSALAPGKPTIVHTPVGYWKFTPYEDKSSSTARSMRTTESSSTKETPAPSKKEKSSTKVSSSKESKK